MAKILNESGYTTSIDEEEVKSPQESSRPPPLWLVVRKPETKTKWNLHISTEVSLRFVFGFLTFLEKCLLSICLQREKLTRMPKTWGEHKSCNFILLQHGWLPIWHHIILDGPTHTTKSSFINLSLTNITLYCNRRIHKLQCHLSPISHYSGPTWRRTSSMRAVSALVESLFNKFPRRGRHPCVSSRSASTSTPWSLISASFSSASTSLRRVCSTSYLNI